MIACKVCLARTSLSVMGSILPSFYEAILTDDITTNDACYEKALEVSNNRSARAKVYKVTY